MRNTLNAELEKGGLAGYSIIGPAPAFAHRLRGKYRWQLTVRGPEPSTLLRRMTFPAGWSIDIDPVGI